MESQGTLHSTSSGWTVIDSRGFIGDGSHGVGWGLQLLLTVTSRGEAGLRPNPLSRGTLFGEILFSFSGLLVAWRKRGGCCGALGQSESED